MSLKLTSRVANLLIAVATTSQLFSQTTTLSFTSIPVTNADLNAPGRGVEQWHDRNDVNVPTEGVNTQRLDVYYRFVWTRLEGPTLGSYTWNYFDSLVNMAITKKQKFGFGIMTVFPGGTLQEGLVAYDGGNGSYPLYLHTLMQAETVKDWRTGSTWTPNYNSLNYQNRLLALNQAIDAHIKSTSFNGVAYKNVISYIDIRGYGAWGEWHSGYTPNNVISDYPAGTFPTVATLKKIVDAHTQGFPDFPLVAMIAGYDANWLQNTMNPPEIAYYLLTQRNNWGLIGWRRDQWGATDSYLSSYLENNTRSFNGLVFKDSIMVRYKSSYIVGEPPAWNPNNYSDLDRQIKLYHATSFGNGNYGVTPTTTIKNNVRAASKSCGYRIIIESGSLTQNGNNLSISLNWKNVGQAPTYENWNVEYQLKNGNTVAWSGQSQFLPKMFQPSATATPVTDNFSIPTTVPPGSYTLNILVKDPNGYRDPLSLAINGRNADGSYTLSTSLPIQSIAVPVVTVVNNCGNSVLTASGYTGTLLWSTGETTASITVTSPGTYSVTQTAGGSTSAPGSGIAAPKSNPAAPSITVADNCGSSLLTANNVTGSLLWSTGTTTSSITVTSAGTYSVNQTVNGCTSPDASATASPKNAIVAAPTVTVVNNCTNSVLTASDYTGALLWSNGSTTASITVSTAGTYNVTQFINGCPSTATPGVAAPITLPPAPTITVVNDCASSVLTASNYTGSLQWSTNETTPSITVAGGGSYTVTQTVNGCTGTAATGTASPKTIPGSPGVSVVNGCGSSTLTATNYTGSLVWSNGATTASITVAVPGTYTVTQTLSGCVSAQGSGNAAPLDPNVTAPNIGVVDNCGNSVLTASGYTGSLLWSNGATTPSITVTDGGNYSATQTVNGCTSPSTIKTASPKVIPTAPTVNVVNNCESSLLIASGLSGSNFIWFNGATTNSITVTTAGPYTVTQELNGCTSQPGTGIAAPKPKPLAPAISVANNCGNSILTASGYTGTLLWSTGSNGSFITVSSAGDYSVSQNVNGCISDNGTATAAPRDANVPTPTISVVNDCGLSTLTAVGYTGSLLWSNGATTESITATTNGNYTLTQTINGCASPAAQATTAPKQVPSKPVITVDNQCENTVLTASGYTGSLHWSNNATAASINTDVPGIFTLTQTVNGCTSDEAVATASPKPIPAAPSIGVTNNCINSVLTANSYSGILLWSNGATTSSITVTTAASYSVTQNVNGCVSDAATAAATPEKETIAVPVISVENNCGQSLLTASGYTGSLTWSNGATTPAITVNSNGTFTVAQIINGCTGDAGSAVAVPLSVPAAPTISVLNDCASSVLTASNYTGSLLWSNGATGNSISVSTAGSYSVSQTLNGCTSSEATKTASPKPIPLAPGVSVVDNCGTSILTATNYTGTLSWSTGASTPSITVTSGGDYSVTQTINGCTSNAGSGTAAPVSSNVSAPEVSVVNNCGNAVLTASQYSGPLTWSNGATTPSITVSSAGTYSVTQLVNGCSSPAGSAIANPVSVPAPPNITVTNNCETSTLTATAYSGTLHWSTGANGPSITVASGGDYSVTQTVNGCESIERTTTASPKPKPDVPGISVADLCGSSTLTATNYTGTLLWSTGSSSSSITVNNSADYLLTQTVNGCASDQATATSNPLPVPAQVTVNVSNNCGNSVLTASGYTGSLIWSTGQASNPITVSNTASYSVTQTVNGCTSNATQVSASPKPIPSAPVVTVTNNCESSQLTASNYTGSLLWSNGQTNQSIIVTNSGEFSVTQTINGCTGSGGSGIADPKQTPAPPTLEVVNNCGNSLITASNYQGALQWSTGATTPSITVSSAGTYSVRQTVNGCTSSPESIDASPLGTSIVAPTVLVTNNCGNSVLTASGYSGSLLWSNGAITGSITVSTGGSYSVTQTINGCSSQPGSGTAAPKLIPSAPQVNVNDGCGNSVLSASNYTGSLLWSNGSTAPSITVTNAATYTVTQTVNGCASNDGSGSSNPFTIPSAPSVSVVNNCGNSVLTATGFTGSLLWSNGSTTSSITVNNAATYTVTQTVNGCTSTTGSGTSAPLGSNVTAPTTSVTNNCGTSILTASNYTGSLLWSNGATTPSITVSNSGTYTVTQTINTCTSAPASAVAAPKAIPAPPVLTVTDNCGNSTLTASAFTGSLLWSNNATTNSITVAAAGNYTVTQTLSGCTSTAASGMAAPKAIPAAPAVTVVNNCGNSVLTASNFTGTLLWSNGATTSSITVSNAATYTVTQTVNGCTSVAGSGTSAPLGSGVTAPTISVVNNCGSSNLTASNFTGSLLWSNGATSSTISVSSGGTYTVTQTINTCTSAPASAVAAPKTIPGAPSLSVADNCGNSVLTASAFTGSLLWSNNATTNSITVTAAGLYSVTQTVNGCTSTAASGTAAPKTIPTAPTVTVVNNCGTSNLTAGNFTGSLLWSNNATSVSINVTTAATYTITQTVNNCQSPAGSGVAAPKTVPVAPTITVANNCGNSVLTASNFTGSLLWSTGATSNAITVTTAANYSVNQTVNGCTSADRTATAAPQAIPSAPTVSVVNNCGNSVLTASNFTGSLLWSNGATTASITVTTPGSYSVTQTVNGCTSSAAGGTAAPTGSTAATPVVTVVNNCGNSVLTASNFTGSLLWSNGATTASITVTTAGTYTVTQTLGGCTSAAGSGVAAPKVIPAAPTVTVVNNCGSSVLTATGTTGSLLWSNNATTSSITVTNAATYTVTQTLNGCTSTSGSGVSAPKSTPVTPSVTVTNNCGNSLLTASNYTGTLLWSNGASTASITVTNAATYTVTQTVNGCTSAKRSATSAPKAVPVAPTVTVTNNCGNSVLTASAFTGTLLWSNNATSTSITVTNAANYTVTQTVNGCVSPARSATSAPKANPTLSSSLTVTAFSGKVTTYVPTSATSGATFSWTRAAVTGVSNPAASGTGRMSETLVNTTTTSKTVTYVYTVTANGCSSTQNVVVTLNPPAASNCVILASITSSFNSTSITAGRYIWFNSVLSRGSLSNVSGTVTFLVTNSKVTFTANSQQYTLDVPSARIRYDAAITSATTQFSNNIWETAVPRSYTGDVFMTGLAYPVPSNLPGSITNIVWTANISIDKPSISATWEWAAAVYSNFTAHSGLNIKPKDGSTQNPYNNNDNAGTPENFKTSLVSGAKGTGGTNYTGSYTSSSTATCSTTTGQRPAGEPLITQQPSFHQQLPALDIDRLTAQKLDAKVLPNPTSNYFNLIIRAGNSGKIVVRIVDVSGRVVEAHDNVASSAVLRIGDRLASGTYFVEVIQNEERKNIKVLKFD